MFLGIKILGTLLRMSVSHAQNISMPANINSIVSLKTVFNNSTQYLNRWAVDIDIIKAFSSGSFVTFITTDTTPLYVICIDLCQATICVVF